MSRSAGVLSSVCDAAQLAREQVRRGYLVYLDLLKKLELFCEANDLIKASDDEDISALSKRGVQIGTACVVRLIDLFLIRYLLIYSWMDRHAVCALRKGAQRAARQARTNQSSEHRLLREVFPVCSRVWAVSSTGGRARALVPSVWSRRTPAVHAEVVLASNDLLLGLWT
jgi:hypothetical protein